MKLSAIKKIYKSTPYSITKSLNALPFSVFAGRPYRSTMNLLRKYARLRESESKDLSEQLLLGYVNESISYTRFYKDWARSKGIEKVSSMEQFFEVPVLSKDQLLEDLDWFLDWRFEKSRYLVTTGGTTGRQLRLYMSNDCFGREWAFVNSYLESHGVDINSRRICLRGVQGVKADELIGYNPLYKELLVSPFRLSLNSLGENWGRISGFGATWIHGYPSSVAEYARLVLELGVDVSNIDHILLVSEALFPDQETIIKRAFNAKILTFYGMTERVVFAPYFSGGFIPHPLYGHTEVHNGEIVGTGFNNFATRLLRYRTGDELDGVTQSRNLVRFDKIYGRWGSQGLVTRNGSKVSMTSLNIHDDALLNVIKYQFYQDVPGSCILKMVVNNKFDKKIDAPNVIRAFQSKVGDDLLISLKFVSDIPLTKRGKHEFIISNV